MPPKVRQCLHGSWYPGCWRHTHVQDVCRGQQLTLHRWYWLSKALKYFAAVGREYLPANYCHSGTEPSCISFGAQLWQQDVNMVPGKTEASQALGNRHLVTNLSWPVSGLELPSHLQQQLVLPFQQKCIDSHWSGYSELPLKLLSWLNLLWQQTVFIYSGLCKDISAPALSVKMQKSSESVLNCSLPRSQMSSCSFLPSSPVWGSRGGFSGVLCIQSSMNIVMLIENINVPGHQRTLPL